MSELFAAVQRLLPKHGISRLGGQIAASELPWLKTGCIKLFNSLYDLDMSEAQRPEFDDYKSFNDFFTRALKGDARPIAEAATAVVSPADGTISQAGKLVDGKLLQAKGTNYQLASLAGESLPAYQGGEFVTVYLAPHNYHRVHLPMKGKLVRTQAIPGALFSVNAKTEAAISDLFCRNERLVCHYETDHGPMLVVLVGALIVASIKTAWSGPQSPYRRIERNEHRLMQSKGAEIGQFLLGSTAIVCFGPNMVELEPPITGGKEIRMGEAIATLQH